MSKSVKQIVVDELEAVSDLLWNNGENGESMGVHRAAQTLRRLWGFAATGDFFYGAVVDAVAREPGGGSRCEHPPSALRWLTATADGEVVSVGGVALEEYHMAWCGACGALRSGAGEWLSPKAG